ncbi:hypothetical protein [Salinigranum halophilum]|uniref:hypothetical protein n=1 Tax=Salinigranum halophilum TaxID=2565931 RepID=UPI00115D9674|nr:hypothetical protein [Salinigranum halophilum]
MTAEYDLIDRKTGLVALPALLIGSAFLPWLVVTAGTVQRKAAGTDLDVGLVLILGGLAVAASWVYKSGKYRVDGWIAGGLLIEGATLWTLRELNQGIKTYRATESGQLYGDFVSFDIGVGFFLAASVAAVIILVGLYEYLTTSKGFAVPDLVGTLIDQRQSTR